MLGDDRSVRRMTGSAAWQDRGRHRDRPSRSTHHPGAMFTPEDRTRLRDALVAAARADPRITAAALTGSAAAGAEDRWSDIDLAFSVAAGADTGAVVADWTERMYREGGAVHHLDVYRGD